MMNHSAERNISAESLAFGCVSGGLRRRRDGRVTRSTRDFVAGSDPSTLRRCYIGSTRGSVASADGMHP